MNLFHQAEWKSFLLSCFRRPWFFPGYGLDLALLVIRRFSNRLRLHLSKDKHQGLKVFPCWLQSYTPDWDMCACAHLVFPEYPLADERAGRNLPLLGKAINENDDVEGYYAKNRWVECVCAMIEERSVADKAVYKALRWIQCALPKSDLAWETYSSCERVVNLVVLLAKRPECRHAIKDEILREFLVDSAKWIFQHLEYYGPKRTNNHILNNARALVVAGSVLNNARVVESGLEIMANMGPRLFQEGGFLRERSSHYQVIVCNWILDAVHFARFAQQNSDKVLTNLEEIESLAKRVSSATSLLFSIPILERVHIGDISPDIHPVLARKRLTNLYTEDFTECNVSSHRRDDWFFISDGCHALVTCMTPECCPAEYTTHGHSDLGGFLWAYRDQPILVDAGRFRYTDDADSTLQIGPQGHNLLMINGFGPLAESVLTSGRWFPMPYSKAEVKADIISKKILTFRHNGFQRIGGVGEHVRSVCIEGDGITVTDHLNGNGTVQIELYWHFPPGFEVITGSGTDIAGDGIVVKVMSKTLDGDIPIHSWQSYPFSAAYGEVQSAQQLKLVYSASLPCVIQTNLNISSCAA